VENDGEHVEKTRFSKGLFKRPKSKGKKRAETGFFFDSSLYLEARIEYHLMHRRLLRRHMSSNMSEDIANRYGDQ
jgi:hypothetical protein